MSALKNLSRLELLALLPESEIRLEVAKLSEGEADSILYDWRWAARPSQLMPGTPGAENPRKDWLFWLALAGRGWGKTRVGAETVREWAKDPNERILMIAPTKSDVQDTMIDGPSGLMSCYPPNNRPTYNSSRHIIQFPSGAVGITRSAEEPERLRGPQFRKFWLDELCACTYAQESWDQVMFGFRLPTADLRGIITTTPKPIKTLKKIIDNPGTVITRGSSYDNRANLSGTYFREVIAPYEGTRLGRQEINAELLEDVPGALWTRTMIDSSRVELSDLPKCVRVVVAIDPAVTAAEDSDETGMIVAGIDARRHIYVIADGSMRASPRGWAFGACRLFLAWDCDRIVAEVNNGGDLVEANLRAVHHDIPYRSVRASRGKYVRAEPVAALYEQGRVHHVGFFPELEEQMCGFVPGLETKSPDRMDALVWAVYDLLLQVQESRILTYDSGYSISPI